LVILLEVTLILIFSFDIDFQQFRHEAKCATIEGRI